MCLWVLRDWLLTLGLVLARAVRQQPPGETAWKGARLRGDLLHCGASEGPLKMNEALSVFASVLAEPVQGRAADADRRLACALPGHECFQSSVRNCGTAAFPQGFERIQLWMPSCVVHKGMPSDLQNPVPSLFHVP